MTPPAAPPPRVFALAVVIAALVFLAAIAVDRVMLPAGLRAVRLQEAPPGAVRVVALGTSKLRSAVAFDADIARRLGPASPLRFHRVTWPSAGLGEMEPALQALLRSPPALLLLESDLLVFDRSPQATWPAPLQHQAAMSRLPRNLLGLVTGRVSAHGNDGVDTWPAAAVCAWQKSPARLAAYARQAEELPLVSAARLEAYLHYLQALRRAGTRVVLLDLGRSPAAMAVFPAAREAAAAVRRRQLREAGLESWAPAPLPPEAAWCDQGHMTAAGQRQFSDWLATALHVWRAAPHE